MIRNLGNMSKCGLLVPMSDAAKNVAETLTNDEILKKGRIHPMQILIALKTYESGRPSDRATKFRKEPVEGWKAVPKVIDALDEAYYKAFRNVEPTGKRFYLGLDISGSMWSGVVAGVNGLTPAVAYGAMAMVTVKTEARVLRSRLHLHSDIQS
jgi:60 kDa SS-A/Ro ribonucleoprotein